MNPEEGVVDETAGSEPETVEETKTSEELLQEVVDNQKAIIEQYQLRAEEQNAQNEQQVQQLQQIIDKIGTHEQVADTGEPSTVDLSPVISKLETIIDNQQTMTAGTNTVVTYGVVYIPLAIIIFLLARFFFTFIRSYR